MCDSIGAGPIAKMVRDEPARFAQLGKWARSPNPWRRRIALYALHDFVLAKELDKPFLLLEKLIADQEFWVQRAVGTWLRECWKRDPQRTEAFLRRHARRLPPVVITVATERASKSFHDELRKTSKAARKV
jgi:3-methyladenine DNA glycosylase AlkD